MYLMYYTDAATGSSYESCADKQFKMAKDFLPADSDEPLPPNPLLEEHASHSSHNSLDDGDGQPEEASGVEHADHHSVHDQHDPHGLIPVPDKKHGDSYEDNHADYSDKSETVSFTLRCQEDCFHRPNFAPISIGKY